MSSTSSQQAAHFTTPLDDSRWSSGGGNSCGSANTSLTSSTSFAMDSLASSHGSTVGDHGNSISPVQQHNMDEPKRSYSACALSLSDTSDGMIGFERKPYKPFRSNEEYLIAMKEDLAEWLNTLYTLDITADNFLNRLETGVILCKHANSVLRTAREWKEHNADFSAALSHLVLTVVDLHRDVPVKANAAPGTFQARDNVANFIEWCRRIHIKECLRFETEDLVARKNEINFVLCLLEVARYGAKFGLLAPTLVQFEQEIDQELEKDQQESMTKRTLLPPTDVSALLSDTSELVFDDTPQQQITNNDLESLHEKVVNLLSRCTCPVQFYLEHLSEGKYRIGDTRTLIFVRILRNHVMVRVGGGWDTLEHYLEKHDPCRCRFAHRSTGAARVTFNSAQVKNPQMQVTFERPDNSCSQPRRSLGSVNSSPSSTRRVFQRAGAITPTSTSDLSTIRRSSTSSNDSGSSMCSLVSASHTDSLVSSEHSSLSSSNSLGSYPVPPILPDRNNNPKDLRGSVTNGSNSPTSKPAPAIPHPKPSPKKRVLATPDSSTRIPKSRIGSSNSNIALTPLLRTTGMNGGCFSATSSSRSSSALTSAHKLKSTSTLAIPQLSSSTTKIPCLDATNKPRHNLSSRYSSHNIYLAVADESSDSGKHASKRLFPANGVSVPAKQRSRLGMGTPLNNRTKQKSSLELNNVSNENFYSLSSNLDKSKQQELEQQSVPNKSPKTPQLQEQQQHRRNHSSSSLPRVTKSAHSSPYLKRRELSTLPGVMVKPSSAGSEGSNENRHAKMTPSKLDAGKRFNGSATSLNSTASTASGSTNSSSSSLHTAVQALSNENGSVMQQQQSKVTSAIPGGNSFLSEPKKPFINADKTPMVEVCSWLERNHLASK